MIDTRMWEAWKARMKNIDAISQSITGKPMLLEDVPGSFTEDEKQTLTRLSQENQDLLDEVIDVYIHSKAGDREKIRQLFRDYPGFRWAVSYQMKGDTDHNLQQFVHYLSILDQEMDTRDFLIKVRHIVQYASKRKLDIASALKDSARLSSSEDRYGWGSTREIFLNAVRNLSRD